MASRSRGGVKAKPDSSSLQSILIAHFNDHQSSGVDLEISRKNVRSALDEYALSNGVQKLMKVTKQKVPKISSNDDDLWAVLTHILDCAIANATLDASKRIVELVAAVLVDTAVADSPIDHRHNIDALLDRLIQFSKCATESVRSLSTFMLIQWFNLSLLAPTKDDDRLNALQQAILPRFTDKAVSVRSETLNISFCSDPDILTAGCFLLQHDPSANNRKLAAERIPVTLQTAEYFVYRVRDVKSTVRCAALAALEQASIRGENLVLDSAQMAEIVLTGCTDRCEETSQATSRVICKWYQAVRFNVTELLKLLDLVRNPDAAEAVLKVLHKVDPNALLSNDFSAAELQAFRDGLQNSLEVLMTDEAILTEQVFAARVGLTFIESVREKERCLTMMIPDIPHLCQVMERNVSQLIKLISQQDYDQDATDRITILFDQLLQIGIMTDVAEEGSRRVLVDAMKTFVSCVSTPDSLIVPCVETLIKVSNHIRNDIDSIFVTLQKLNEGLHEVATIRTLVIANLALEKASFNVPDINDLLSDKNAMIRQGAVECFGKMGMYVSLETVKSEHWPVLLRFAQDDNEEICIRSQAALALTDFSILMGHLDTEFRRLVNSWLGQNELAGVGSEIAVKLLVAHNNNPDDEEEERQWIATLLLKFFESSEGEEDDANELEVGSPSRLQQLLALFLPNMAHLNREAFVGCIQSLLEASPKLTSTKIVEYVVETAENSPCKAETSSPKLLASIQVASYLAKKSSDISKTLLRSLCKLMGTWEFDIDKEFYDNLSLLKELVDEMLTNDIVEDAKARESLKACYTKLGDVEMEEEVEDDDDEEANQLADAVVQLQIAVGDENMVGTPTVETPLGKDVAVLLKGSWTTGAKVEGSLRRSRRFRPSN